MDVAAVRVCTQLEQPVDRVDEILGAVADAGGVAVPEARELQRQVERGGAGAPLRAAGRLEPLTLGAPALLLGQELELVHDALPDFGFGRVAVVPGLLEDRKPRPRREVPV